MRVLVAPQEFKESLAAHEAAEAMAAGIRAAQPGWTLDILPFSDGGPGFMEALRRTVRSEPQALVVHDAIGRPVVGRVLAFSEGNTVAVEAAQANGLYHLTPEERDPLYADSAGVGELILGALEHHPQRLIIGVGGSATTDGGCGMARALGARFYDAAGRELAPGGAPLAELERIEWQRPPALTGVEISVATDVTNPLLGPLGAAAVYAPQKGATPEHVRHLEAALDRYADVIRRTFGIDLSGVPGAGAAGGLAAGIVAFLGGQIVSGFDVVAETSGLEQRLSVADAVVTGEGSFDGQSLQGKTTGRLLEAARAAGKPCVVFAGVAEVTAKADLLVYTLAEVEPDRARSLREAYGLLESLAAQWASGYGAEPVAP